MDTHTDDFIQQRPGLTQPIVRSAVSRREGPPAFFATVPPPSALRGDVEGVSNDVAFAGLASQGAIGVWTAARSSAAPLHTCLMAENPEKIQLAQQIAGLLDTVNNTSLKKHPNSVPSAWWPGFQIDSNELCPVISTPSSCQARSWDQTPPFRLTRPFQGRPDRLETISTTSKPPPMAS